MFIEGAIDHWLDEYFETLRPQFPCALDQIDGLLFHMLGTNTRASRLLDKDKLTVDSPETLFRGLLINCYDGTMDDHSTRLWCPILGMYLPRKQMASAHIVPKVLNSKPYLVRKVIGIRADSVDGFLVRFRNGLMMSAELKGAWDAGHFIIVQDKDFLTGQAPEFRIHVMRDSVLYKTAIEGSSCRPTLTFRELHGRVLNFPVGCTRRPSTRCLFFRMIWAILQARAGGEFDWNRQIASLKNDWPLRYHLKYLVGHIIDPLWRTSIHSKLPDFIATSLFSRDEKLTDAEAALAVIDLLHSLEQDLQNIKPADEGECWDFNEYHDDEYADDYSEDGSHRAAPLAQLPQADAEPDDEGWAVMYTPASTVALSEESEESSASGSESGSGSESEGAPDSPSDAASDISSTDSEAGDSE
jgi:hypothetical protein